MLTALMQNAEIHGDAADAGAALARKPSFSNARRVTSSSRVLAPVAGL